MLFLITARLEHVIQDMWIGLFWKHEKGVLDIYVTLVPSYPFHVQIIVVNECGLCHKHDDDLTPWYIATKGTLWLCDYCLGAVSGLPICLECGTHLHVGYCKHYNNYFCQTCMESQGT